MADERAPMKLRRRVPGMPPSGDPAEQTAPGLVAVTSPSPEESDGAQTGEGQLVEERAEPNAAEAVAKPATKRSPTRRLKASVPAGGEPENGVNPYTGAGTTSLNVRVLVPLHGRYRQLVRALEDEGYRTSSTEIFQALLHFGPANTDEARELIRRWRAVLDADPSR